MSGPTKGMVAGQAIQTGELTREYEEGHQRVFGTTSEPGRSRRSRTVYPADGSPPYEVGEDWEETVPEKPLRCDLYMDGLRATDGTDISSKAKRREYMHRKGLADTSDFTEHWKKKAKEREAILSGEADSKWRRETIGKLLYESKRKPRK